MRKSVYSKEYKALTRLLRDVRLEAGLTQQDVADKLRMPQSFVAKYESGERRLDVIEFIVISRALRSPADVLLRRLLRMAN
jgi:transcriptional regulator with XRE-family HTH domain